MTTYRFFLAGDCLLSKTVRVEAEDAGAAVESFSALSPEIVNALPWTPSALTVLEDVGLITDDENADDVDDLDEPFRERLEFLFD